MRRANAALIVLLATGTAVPRAAGLDLPEIRTRGVLRVLVSADEEPAMYNFKAGEPGFERELIEGFARINQLRVEAIPVASFGDIMDDLNAGKGDLIAGIIVTEARRRQVDFSAEVLPARHLAVNLKGKPAIQTVEQLRQERVGVIRETSWATAAREAGIPDAQIEGLADRGALFEALESGKVSAMVMSVSDFSLALRRHDRFQAGVFVSSPGSAAWAVRKSDGALRQAIDAYLDNSRKAGAWSRLIVKYLGEGALGVLKAAGQK